MDLRQANIEQLSAVKRVTIETISEIYPHYYPKGAVDFFLSHHNDKNISQDIQSRYVYLLYNNDEVCGTITIKENQICRLFVLPQYQRKGFGSIMLNFAEKKISKCYQECILDASLPAKVIYLKRGYKEVNTYLIETDSGDFLCYDIMRKDIKSRK